MSSSQATTNVKRDIVEGNVEPGFFETVGSLIGGAAAAVKDACAVM